MNITDEEWAHHDLNPDRLEFKVTKINPKPDAKTYRLRTVEDMFKVINEDNVEGFLKELHIIFLTQFMLLATEAEGDKYFKHIDFTDD